MAIEMLLNDDIQHFIFSNDFKLSKENKCNYVHYSRNLKSKLDSFDLNKTLIRYECSKFMFL
jgi:hypothetical protein